MVPIKIKAINMSEENKIDSIFIPIDWSSVDPHGDAKRKCMEIFLGIKTEDADFEITEPLQLPSPTTKTME